MELTLKLAAMITVAALLLIALGLFVPVLSEIGCIMLLSEVIAALAFIIGATIYSLILGFKAGIEDYKDRKKLK